MTAALDQAPNVAVWSNLLNVGGSSNEARANCLSDHTLLSTLSTSCTFSKLL